LQKTGFDYSHTRFNQLEITTRFNHRLDELLVGIIKQMRLKLLVKIFKKIRSKKQHMKFTHKISKSIKSRIISRFLLALLCFFVLSQRKTVQQLGLHEVHA